MSVEDKQPEHEDNIYNLYFTIIAVAISDTIYKSYRWVRYRLFQYLKQKPIQVYKERVAGEEYTIEYPEVTRHWSYLNFTKYFRSLDSNIQSIGSKYNTSEYIARSLAISVVTGLLGVVSGYVIVTLISSLIEIPPLAEIEFGISFGTPLWLFDLVVSVLSTIFVSAFAFSVGFLVSVITFYCMIYWTSYVKSEQTRQVEEMYPYGITFMYALSKTTEDVEKLIRVTARQKSVLGSFAEEMQDIVNYVDLYNIGFRQALNQKQTETSSRKIRNLMQVFSQAHKQGGGITDILADFHRQSVEVEENKLEEKTEFKELLVEMMLTIGAGIAVIMVLFVGLTLLAPIKLPLLLVTGASSVFFYTLFAVLIYYLDLNKEVAETEIAITQYNFLSKIENQEDLENLEIVDTTSIHGPSMDEEFHFKVSQVNEYLSYFQETLFSPLATVKESPVATLIFTIPLTVLYYVFIIGFETIQIQGTAVPSPVTRPEFVSEPIISIWAIILVPYILLLAPVALFHELKNRRKKKIFADLPLFTDSLNRTIKTGESMKDAVSTDGLVDINPRLREELTRTRNEIDWFGDPNTALSNLTTRLEIPEFTQVMQVVITTSQVSSNLEEALDIASSHLSRKRSIREKEQSTGTMLSALSFIISLFFVGIYVLMESLFIRTFTELIPEDGGGGGISQLTGGAVDFAAIDAGILFIALLWAVVMIQLGGQLKTQSVLGSIKYGIFGSVLVTILILIGVTFAPTL